MKLSYPAVIEPSSDGFGVYFPDLDGCTSWGANQDEALANAEDALSLHLEGMREDGVEFPAPSPPQALARDPSGRSLLTIVRAEAPDASERVNVYLPRSLLERIDRYADKAGLNRSAFFGLASRRMLGEAEAQVAEKG